MLGREQTVLFVDDEPNILSALSRLLRKEKWSILTATSGREGLSLLESEAIDLVVSDMLMEEMDGAEFLKRVKEGYPKTTRIILTGYPKSETVTRAFAEADIQQLVSKPWDTAELKEIISTALRQSESHEQEAQGLHEIINEIEVLPSLPHIYAEVRELLESEEESSAESVAEVIMRDPAISAKILQVANSAYFGQRRQVETVNRAVVLLGQEMVCNLVLATSVFQSMATENVEGFSHDGLWKHAMACSLAAKIIAKRLAPGDHERVEKAMLAGILHDLGKLVFAQFMSERYAEVIEVARRDGCSIAAAELESMGATHAAVGGHLAEWWNLSPQVVDAINWHHQPGNSTEEPSFVATIHVANALAHQVENPEGEGERLLEIDTFATDQLGLSEHQLSEIGAELAAELQSNE